MFVNLKKHKIFVEKTNLLLHAPREHRKRRGAQKAKTLCDIMDDFSSLLCLYVAIYELHCDTMHSVTMQFRATNATNKQVPKISEFKHLKVHLIEGPFPSVRKTESTQSTTHVSKPPCFNRQKI